MIIYICNGFFCVTKAMKQLHFILFVGFLFSLALIAMIVYWVDDEHWGDEFESIVVIENEAKKDSPKKELIEKKQNINIPEQKESEPNFTAKNELIENENTNIHTLQSIIERNCGEASYSEVSSYLKKSNEKQYQEELNSQVIKKLSECVIVRAASLNLTEMPQDMKKIATMYLECDEKSCWDLRISFLKRDFFFVNNLLWKVSGNNAPFTYGMSHFSCIQTKGQTHEFQGDFYIRTSIFKGNQTILKEAFELCDESITYFVKNYPEMLENLEENLFNFLKEKCEFVGTKELKFEQMTHKCVGAEEEQTLNSNPGLTCEESGCPASETKIDFNSKLFCADQRMFDLMEDPRKHEFVSFMNMENCSTKSSLFVHNDIWKVQNQNLLTALKNDDAIKYFVKNNKSVLDNLEEAVFNILKEKCNLFTEKLVFKTAEKEVTCDSTLNADGDLSQEAPNSDDVSDTENETSTN